MTTQIFEQILKKDKDGKTISKFAILRNMDTDQLNKDIVTYWGGALANMFVDIKLIDPWTRVIISGITELPLLTKEQLLRKQKLEKICQINS